MMATRRVLGMCRAIARSAVAGCLVALVACSSGTPVPPIDHPFALVPGHRVHGRFAIREQRLYAVDLVYPFDTPAQRNQVLMMAGGSGSSAPGAELTLRVQITEIRDSGSRLIRGRDIPRPKVTSWTGNTLSSELTRLPLSPGLYTFDIRVVDAAPSLREVPVRVGLHEAYPGK
jgi:hypothetical protein